MSCCQAYLYEENWEKKYSKDEKLVNRKNLLNFEVDDDILRKVIKNRMKENGIDLSSYFLPILFFMFLYVVGILINIPLINSIFTKVPVDIFIPITATTSVPLIVIEWGFLGGLVYTSISLLARFLRNDLTPRVYLNASFRLILSAVVSVIIWFLIIPTGILNINQKPPNADILFNEVLLLVFLAGVAPIQLLVHFPDTQLSKIYKGWIRRSTAGNRPIAQLEGINSVTAARLSEEGIDYIQQLALCNPKDIAERSKFSLAIVDDWKNQAILQTVTGDIVFIGKNILTSKGSDKPKKEFLNDILNKKLCIRTMSALIKNWNDVSTGKENKTIYFFKSLGLLDDRESNVEELKCLFDTIIQHGEEMIQEV